MHLLTLNQTKMLKAEGTGYLSAILHLQPAWSYKKVETCSGLHGVCAKCCIAQTGRGRFSQAVEARKRRTRLFVDQSALFYALLDADLLALTEKARKTGLIPTCRLNGTSDLPWESYSRDGIQFGILPRTGKGLFESHPGIRFYDYTKDPNRVLAQSIANYSLTFSASERSTEAQQKQILDSGHNVAMVFGIKRGEELPKTHLLEGKRFKVVDGDRDDLRFPERDGRGVIIGLRYKLAFSAKTGKAVQAPPQFVILSNNEGNHVTA